MMANNLLIDGFKQVFAIFLKELYAVAASDM